MNTQKKYVSYIRVSTQRQGQSGLGLEAQQAKVAEYLTQRGGILIGEFREIESGTKADREELDKALKLARLEGATLLIAKLDRLARNVAFIANLLEARVEIAACDLPDGNKFTFQIMAAVAEQEARSISERTISALKAAKARGTKLGFSNPNRKDQVRSAALSAKVRKDAARNFSLKHGPKLLTQRKSGETFKAIAEGLNVQEVPTRTGKRWNPSTVKLVLKTYQDSISAAET